MKKIDIYMLPIKPSALVKGGGINGFITWQKLADEIGLAVCRFVPGTANVIRERRLYLLYNYELPI
jgi:hypothetical protein